ncbi:CSC1-like protein RXW8 [Vitis vinifera]|uniref:CSC1-like protein RXW8 n=1 Tax=Vitis vinifera TaxID=29760 RepID=A0A438KN62_VITVI|nr:CSC1-like protein RXW8 [Vitis vinifera]
MKLYALLTSAGINIAFCAILLSLYSILRKQPSNVSVYFGRRLAQFSPKPHDPFCFERFVPSPGWMVKAWETSEEEILSVGGMDAVVFLRIVVFSIRIFAIAAIICIFLVLPVNYYGQAVHHGHIPSESLDVFTIGNIKEGSKWLWVHCFALYVISCSACVLLYFEYKSITNMRLAHITGSPPNPSHFAVLVRSIPWSPEQSYSDLVKQFFINYHASSYLSHQMVSDSWTVHKLVIFNYNTKLNALIMSKNKEVKKGTRSTRSSEKRSNSGIWTDAYKMLQTSSMKQSSTPSLIRCSICGVSPNSFKILSNDPVKDKVDLDSTTSEEGASAFVFFKTRYAAVVASQVLQSSNPMLWVTDLAPEPHDVYWSNLCIPYKQLWIRRITTLLAAIVFMFLFLLPVTFVQGLTQLEQLQQTFPFLRGILKKSSVPVLSNCLQLNASKSIISDSQWSVFSSVKDLPTELARAVPTQVILSPDILASFFMTYVLTSGWASMSFEVVQVFALLCNYFTRFILKKDPSNETLSFPYHTEIPKALLFGLLGFTCSILAPLILPILLVYFFLAYLVYRNQIINVYISKYESGGKFWPIVHNTTIFSLVLAQIIAIGVFGLKRSPVPSGFTIPLVIGTLLFNEYCRQRFRPIFENHAATVLIEMDRQDERNGRMEQIHHQLHSAYHQPKRTSQDSSKGERSNHSEDGDSIQDPEDLKPGLTRPILRTPS